MQEIKCPNCGTVFQVDESGYTQILQQVRDREFEKELQRRKQELEQKKNDDMTIALMEQERNHRAALEGKNAALAEKEQEIQRLRARLSSAES